jgi:hypothetical protein
MSSISQLICNRTFTLAPGSTYYPFGPSILLSEAAHLRSSKVARYELVTILKRLKNNAMMIRMVKNRSIGWPQQGVLSKRYGSRLEIARKNLGKRKGQASICKKSVAVVSSNCDAKKVLQAPMSIGLRAEPAPCVGCYASHTSRTVKMSGS